jgi:hypothetical protein
MFRKIIATSLLVSIFTLASGSNVFGQIKLSDESRPVSPAPVAQNEKLRDAFTKKKYQSDFSEPDNLAAHQKQKSQGQKFSTGTKILIGVAIVAVVAGIVVFAASRDKVEPFKNGVL